MQPLASSSRYQKESPRDRSQGSRRSKGKSKANEELPLSKQILSAISYPVSISIPDSSNDDDLPGPDSYIGFRTMTSSQAGPSHVVKASSSLDWQTSTKQQDIDRTQRRASGSVIDSNRARASKHGVAVPSIPQSYRPPSTSSLARQSSRADPKNATGTTCLHTSQTPISQSSRITTTTSLPQPSSRSDLNRPTLSQPKALTDGSHVGATHTPSSQSHRIPKAASLPRKGSRSDITTPTSSHFKAGTEVTRLSASQTTERGNISRRGELLARHRPSFAASIPQTSSLTSISSSSSAITRCDGPRLNKTPSSLTASTAPPSSATGAIESKASRHPFEHSKPSHGSGSQVVSGSSVPKTRKLKVKEPVCVDLTEDSPPPPPRMSSQKTAQSKLVFKNLERRDILPTLDVRRNISIDGKGSFDNPFVLTPTPSPTRPTNPLPPIGRRTSEPPTTPPPTRAGISRSSYFHNNHAIAEGSTLLADEMSCSLSAASAAADSPNGTAAFKSASLVTPQLSRQSFGKQSSSTLSDLETPQRHSKKRAGGLLDEHTDTSQGGLAPEGRSLRKRPPAGFFTMPNPGTAITLWPQHVKSEVVSPRRHLVKVVRKEASPASTSPLTPQRRDRAVCKQTRLRQVQVVNDSSNASSTSSPSDSQCIPKVTRQQSHVAAIKEEVASPYRAKGRMVCVEIERRNTIRALSSTPQRAGILPATGSLDSPVRGLNTPVRAFTRRSTSPLTPLPSKTRPGASGTLSQDSPVYKQLSKSARKRLHSGEVIPSSILGEQALWSSPASGMRVAKMESQHSVASEQPADSDNEVLALDPYGDFDFFDTDPQCASASKAAEDVAPAVQSIKAEVKLSNDPPIESVKLETTDDSAASEAEARAARLQKLRQQIQDRARAEAQAEAEEADRVRAAAHAALGTTQKEHDLDLSDDDLDDLILAPRRSTRQSAAEVKPTVPTYSLSPEPESSRLAPGKQSMELHQTMQQIVKKRKNGETASDLIRMLSATEDLVGRELSESRDLERSPRKRARSDCITGPYPTPISGGAQSPVGQVDGSVLSNISMAKVKALLGEDAEMLQDLASPRKQDEDTGSSDDLEARLAFWVPDILGQIGEPVIPSFEVDTVLTLLTNAALACDTSTMITLLSTGIASTCSHPKNRAALSRWLFEIATLSSDEQLASTAFMTLDGMVSTTVNPFGGPEPLLNLLHHSIISFGARITACAELKSLRECMQYNMETSKRIAAADFWVRLTDSCLSHGHLPGSAARELIPTLVEMALDITTPNSLKLAIGACVARALTLCEEQDEQYDLACHFKSSTPEVVAAAIKAVGRATPLCRRQARWMATTALTAAAGLDLVHILEWVPSVEEVRFSLRPLAQAIDIDDPTSSQVVTLSSLFIETITDVEALLLQERRLEDQHSKHKRSSIDQLCREIVKLSGRINDNKGENVAMSLVKSRLYNFAVSVDRQRVFFERKHQWTSTPGGTLERGEGGQTRLSFGGIS